MNLIAKLMMLIVLVISTTYASEDVPTQEEVSKLYVATFNRAPDAAGLTYWTNDANLKLSEIAQSFFEQEETKTLYPINTTNRDFIKSVYQNLFNREPDTAGWNYWEGELNEGKYSKNLFIQTVIGGAQDSETSFDATILENKNSVGIYFAQAGLDDTNEAKSIMSDVTADTSTVNIAFTNITNNINIKINNIVNDYNYDTCSKEWKIIKDSKCVLKTCESDYYNCPACGDGKVLKYYNNGLRYCEENTDILSLPAIPMDVEINSEFSTQITINWSKVDDATYYDIYQSDITNGTYSLIESNIPNNKLVIIIPNTEIYYYKIKACNGSNSCSNYSDVAIDSRVTPLVSDTLSKPLNLEATSGFENLIPLNWSSVDGATYYNVYQSNTTNGTYSLIKNNLSNNYFASTISDDEIYYFKVSACNSQSCSEDSDIVSGKRAILVIDDEPSEIVIPEPLEEFILQ